MAGTKTQRFQSWDGLWWCW